jgi:hypothetical protein
MHDAMYVFKVLLCLEIYEEQMLHTTFRSYSWQLTPKQRNGNVLCTVRNDSCSPLSLFHTQLTKKQTISPEHSYTIIAFSRAQGGLGCKRAKANMVLRF